jgi:hypothetical protein
MNVIQQMMDVTQRCKGIDFTQVTRDQAIAHVKSLCNGMTDQQMAVVIKNVFGDQS